MAKKEYPYACKYNPNGVRCDDTTKCDKCGWKPAVDQKRRRKLWELETLGFFKEAEKWRR